MAMTNPKDTDNSRETADQGAGSAPEKLSRREFAKTSVVASAAAAVGIPSVVHAGAQSTDEGQAAESARKTAASGGSNEWREGTTIPAEYYLDAEIYNTDERHIAENLWLLADHVSRIPEPGDFFVFKYGIGDSAIVVRNESGDINAFHNVCRHRGSRLMPTRRRSPDR
jgi:hypothetical protein